MKGAKKNKILIMPDSFKGSLSASRFCDIVENEIKRSHDAFVGVKWPMADGGEGTVAALHTCLGGQLVQREVTGPYANSRTLATYGLVGDLAYIEMASAAGLPLVKADKRPLESTTFGVGELIDDAIERGAKRILLGLGGSATNDMGCGCAAALGAVFYDDKGDAFLPTGGTLKDVAGLYLEPLREKLKSVSVTAMCDIDNPLYGPEGAAYVFAPQKGADLKTVHLLDEGLRHLASVLTCAFEANDQTKCPDFEALKGGGAAGGFGAGVVALLNGQLRGGTDYILDLLAFENQLEDVAFIVTGEGYLDAQSLFGKTVVGISRRAKAKHVPVVALVGAYDVTLAHAYEEAGISAVFSLSVAPQSIAEAMINAESQLSAVARQVIALWQAAKIHE